METQLRTAELSEKLFSVLSQGSQQAVDSDQIDEIMSNVAQSTLKAAGAGIYVSQSKETLAWTSESINSELRTAYPQLFG